MNKDTKYFLMRVMIGFYIFFIGLPLMTIGVLIESIVLVCIGGTLALGGIILWGYTTTKWLKGDKGGN